MTKNSILNLIFIFIFEFISPICVFADKNEINNLPAESFNTNVQVSRINEKIYLQGKDCALLIKESRAIEAWTKKLNEKFIEHNCLCKAGNCSLEITNLVPKFVQENQSLCPVNSGPNCWNTVLVGSNILNSLRYTSKEEMNFWMNSPLCREIDKTKEPLKPGDIVAIRENQKLEIHGFIYISNNLVFSKNGYYEAPYSFQSPENVFKSYNVPLECRSSFKEPTNKSCNVYANYFRCESIKNYENKKKVKNAEYEKTNKALSDLECRVSTFVFGSDFDKTIASLIDSTLSALLNDAEAKLKVKEQSAQYYFEWQSIRLRVMAIQIQAGLIF